MNKKIHIVVIGIIAAILFSIFTLYNVGNIANNKSKESEYTQASNDTTDVETKTIKNITEIETPDEIIYFDGENKVVITKDNINFEKIVNANKDRNLGELSKLELVINFKDDEKHNFLEYKYNDNSSIYFTINTDKENFIWIPHNNQLFVSGAYGHINTATELIKILY